ncbi:hypothetical protein EDC65_5360 [Stella humosa]|uniref:Inner membrane protein n=1 Tax=Stella humosa TaxID=94 RepID=A0A3N1KUI8_9PROT|nr:hypothetical protein [Stella humosa]ROP81025.1 hypothetical protein EDC65_5360 [Stella humosa]BBK29715.1 hypothetical protein STHU_03490 [Stella humosa]
MATDTHEPSATEAGATGARVPASTLARWAIGIAITALVLVVSSPVWLPMLRGTQPDRATVAVAAEEAQRIAAVQTAPLAQRIAALEATVQKLAAAGAATPDIRRLALAGAVAQLRPAVARPTPFAVELAVVAGLAERQPAYAAGLRLLAPHATSGIPTLRQLRARFATHVEAALMAEAGNDEVPLVAQFVTWMASTAPFGTGQMIHDITMPATAAALRAADQRLAAEDLDGAVAALAGLTRPAAAAMRPWIEGVRARADATRAMDLLVGAALADLPASAR